MQGWAKVKDAAKYAGMSERTFREWLKKVCPIQYYLLALSFSNTQQ